MAEAESKRPRKTPSASKKGGKSKRGSPLDRRLTDAEWAQAREMWEDDTVREVSSVEVADHFGVRLAAVKDRVTRHRWTRRSRKQLVLVPRPEPPRPPWRPSKYRDEFCQMLIDYFESASVDHAGYDGNMQPKFVPGKENEPPVMVKQRFPTLERFAASIGVAVDTLNHWAYETDAKGKQRRPDFFHAYKRARSIQVALLVERGLAGELQPAVSIFALKNLAGWQDKTEPKGDDSTAYPTKEKLATVYQNGLERMRAQREELLKRRGISKV